MRLFNRKRHEATLRCSGCGELAPEGARECSMCGEALDSMRNVALQGPAGETREVGRQSA